MTEQAPAKINLVLDVVGRRTDGYHTIRSVMQTVDWCDTVTAERGEGLTLSCADAAVPTDHRNTVIRAAEAFYAALGRPPQVALTLTKEIPVGGGMGGESTDAAATLRLLDRLEQTALPVDALCQIGKTVGMDVPFCVTGGTALVEGVGDVITPCSALTGCVLLVAKPSVSIATPSAYAAIDREWARLRHPNVDAALTALAGGDLAALGRSLGNVFEQTTALPQVADLKDTMRRCGAAGCTMTGSGSAVVGLFADRQAADACLTALRPLNVIARICRPYAKTNHGR